MFKELYFLKQYKQIVVGDTPLKSAGLNTNHGKKMDATLLQKVEELTLYVLQLKKENEKQQQEIEGLVKESCKN